MKGLENAIRNLNSLDTRMVPQASAWAINRVAQKAVSVATRQVAGNSHVCTGRGNRSAYCGY